MKQVRSATIVAEIKICFHFSLTHNYSKTLEKKQAETDIFPVSAFTEGWGEVLPAAAVVTAATGSDYYPSFNYDGLSHYHDRLGFNDYYARRNGRTRIISSIVTIGRIVSPYSSVIVTAGIVSAVVARSWIIIRVVTAITGVIPMAPTPCRRVSHMESATATGNPDAYADRGIPVTVSRLGRNRQSNQQNTYQ